MRTTGGDDHDGSPDGEGGGDDELRLAPLPRWAERRLVTIAPGDVVDHDPDVWRDAMVIVADGAIELECTAGGRRSFDTGSILWCHDLAIRRIHSTGLVPAVLVSISRRSRPP